MAKRHPRVAMRRRYYALEQLIDPVWWLIIPIVLFVLGLFGMYALGTTLPMKIAGIFIVVELAAAAVLTVYTWLFVENNSSKSVAQEVNHTQCWANIAEISRKNAEPHHHH
jgi:hypothetical protein